MFNRKAKLWCEGRKESFSQLNKLNKNQKTVWFHCSSLGEFEQGRPVLEAFRKKHPQHQVLLTFFSPSGYEIRKNYNQADCVCYLPMDTKSNANKFINIVNPEIVFFVKYEYWFNYITVIKQRNIPLIVISAIFRTEQYFFQWYGKIFRKKLMEISRLFIQDKESYELLNKFDFKNIVLSGDTRIDRVVEISKEKWSDGILDKFSAGKKVIVCGSTWEPDEKILSKLQLGNNFALIIAPHQIDGNHISSILDTFSHHNIKQYSKCTPEEAEKANVMVIDTIGILSYIYRYGIIAYIGGGFGKSIHNTLEAAVYGIPVIFGPNYQKFKEARELVALNAAFSIKNDEELKTVFENLTENSTYIEIGEISRNYIIERKDVVRSIIESVSAYIK